MPDSVIEFCKKKVDREALRENLKVPVERRLERTIEAEWLRVGNLVDDGSHI